MAELFVLGLSHPALGLDRANAAVEVRVDQPPAGGHGAAVGQHRFVFNHRRRAAGAPDDHLERSLGATAEQLGHRGHIIARGGVVDLGRHGAGVGSSRRPK